MELGGAFIPEVTNLVRTLGPQRLGTSKVCYVARCFRDETTTDRERLREFTQVGVEILGDNPLDLVQVARKDALRLFKKMMPEGGWKMEKGVERGLRLYQSGKTFEVTSLKSRKQLLGGGAYEGGAGWALGLERLSLALSAP